MTAVIQVLLDTIVANAEPVGEPDGLVGSPWSGLRTRVRAVRQRARGRLRARKSRMGIDPGTADYVVDALDQQIEVAVARVENIISVAQQASEPLAAQERAAIVEKLHDATEEIEQAVERADTIVPAAEDSLETGGPTVELPLAELSEATGEIEQGVKQVELVIAATADSQGPVQGGEREAIVDNLDQATQRFKDAVQDVETMVVTAQAPAEEIEGADRA
jgi:hypothetical protein